MVAPAEKGPSWGDTPEYHAWSAAQHAQDPTFTTLLDPIREAHEAAKAAGDVTYSEFLDGLSGVGVFAVRGTIHVPRTTRQFGDWLLVQNDRDPQLIGEEVVDTQDDHPYVRGKLAYTIRSARIHEEHGVMVIAEADVEDGPPRVIFPLQVERFEPYRVHSRNILDAREEKYNRGVLRFLDATRRTSSD